ncbi:MAG: 1-deoxy-D-xylulose-5-phosphate reductoisomerase [Rhodopirellula sp. TMED11]|nr:MAG: 1-deoxy-D-xylulose-5-phosphate reductoisomerase [Rhodopirellula sp. TMED11]
MPPLTTSGCVTDAAGNSQDRNSQGQADHQQSESAGPSNVNVAVLGATGSIGTATADVIENLQRVDPQRNWRLWAASGHRNLDELKTISERFHQQGQPLQRLIFSSPEAISSAQAATRFADCGLSEHAFAFGPEALCAAASDPAVDTVVAAIVGRAGLESTLAAVEAGKRVALANKETLVVAGSLVQRIQESSRAPILPVDSEHSAIFQCLADSKAVPTKLILTASGGPFRAASVEQMQNATPKDALAHPTWQMGRKISIDSATMMNKALEIIEARWLFDFAADQIEVMVHPQSIIHSMVEFADGSTIAQLSPPDMRLPIQYALTYPQRMSCPAPALDRRKTYDLTLLPADQERFPALALGFQVAKSGGTSGAVVNAANEVAVESFLNEQIRFTDIVPLCQKVLENHTYDPNPSLTQLLQADRWARKEAQHCVG